MPTVEFKPETGITIQKLKDEFKMNNIDARDFFWPLSSLPMFDDKKENRYAWQIPHNAINLPSYHDMSMIEQKRVIDVLVKLYQFNHRI